MGMRGAIRLDDPTSSGGRIISASGFMNVDGKPVACVGDKATCHLGGHGGTVTIVEGSSSDIMMGRMIAYDGCALSCGCHAMATTTRYMLEPNRGGTGSLVRASAPMDSNRSHIMPAMNIHNPDSALPESNQRSIGLLKPIAEKDLGKKDDVLVLIWSWKRTGVYLHGSSVGHVAIAIQVAAGEWSIVQSQFPHGLGGPSSTTGPNTTISGWKNMYDVEGDKPNGAFLVTLPNIGGYAQEAINDLRKPLWNWDPRYGGIHKMAENETNCTYGTIKALRAGGASFPGLFASKHLTPGGPWLPNDLKIYLEDEIPFNVRRETNPPAEQWFVHAGVTLMESQPWGKGVLTT